MSPEQGNLANSSGNTLEQAVKSVFQSKGFTIISYSEWAKSPDGYGEEVLLRNAPYTSIYGHRGRTEFLAISARYNFKIRIECKWQQSSGSVDEKLPYLYLNSIEAMPENHIVIIIDGDGFKEGAVSWLRRAVQEKFYGGGTNNNKLIEVLNLREFITWANRILR